jgi:hypothetical protein
VYPTVLYVKHISADIAFLQVSLLPTTHYILVLV